MKKIPIEELLKDIDSLNGNSNIKKLIGDFVENQLISASGIIIIWTHGKHVNIDGSQFSETEAVWALEKAKNQILNKGIKFD